MNKNHGVITGIAQSVFKISNKLNKLEKKAIDFGTGEKYYASELHTIEAIGEKYGNTVTELCDLFGTTKGAISQIISRLEKKELIAKERNRDCVKEINISLTRKGRIIFKSHKELHKKMDVKLLSFMKAMPKDQLDTFLFMLKEMEKYIDEFIRK
jgi:DNA-binding MarR family transcriptional regulator